MPLDNSTIGTLSVGGVSLLGDFETARLEPDNQTQRYDGNNVDGMGSQITKLGYRFTVELFSTKGAGPDRVSHLDLSEFLIGGSSYLASFESLDLNGTFEMNEVPAGGQLWRIRQPGKKDYKATASLSVPNTGGVPLFVDAASSTLSNRNKVLKFTLNGVAIELPMMIEGVPFPVEREGLLKYTVELMGKVPATGAYPTTPIGTTTLLEKALNAYKTPLAFLFSPHASEGFDVSGNVVFAGFGVSIRDGDLVKTSYEFLTTGDVTVAGN